MEKESKLFDKRFVHFMWDDQLEGKVCIVAANMRDLISGVENDGNGAIKTNALHYSGDETKPFHPFLLGKNCFYRFAYYDPNYSVKWAYYKEGKKVQFKNCFGNWNDCDTPEWYDNYEYRVKPESLGYARVETKGSDCDKQEGYTLAVSKCHWEDYIDHALPKENILDKPECPCEEGIDSKACVGCEHSEDGKPVFRPYENVHEFIQDHHDRFPTAVPRPCYTLPFIWLKSKRKDFERQLVYGFYDTYIKMDNTYWDFSELFNQWTYLDGSPVGKEC